MLGTSGRADKSGAASSQDLPPIPREIAKRFDFVMPIPYGGSVTTASTFPNNGITSRQSASMSVCTPITSTRRTPEILLISDAVSTRVLLSAFLNLTAHGLDLCGRAAVLDDGDEARDAMNAR